MTDEINAEHLMGLALRPRRTRKELDDRVDARCVRRNMGTKQNAVPSGRRPDVYDNGQASVEFVDRREPIEEVAAQFVARGAYQARPAAHRNVDRRSCPRATA